MPRIRTIKPDFFQHEALFDAERESGLPLRIAFAGLWTVADKAGRFEWRPRQLKLNVLPYDDIDFSAVLSALESYGFVMRYAVDEKTFGAIPSWDRHQHKNTREPDSTIPGPDEDSTWQAHAPAKASAEQAQSNGDREGKGREGKGKDACSARTAALATPGLDVASFERWEAYRVEIRKALKPSSLQAAAVELAKFGQDQSAVVQQSIANGWQGLFELKRTNGKHAPAEKPRRERPPTQDEIAAARRLAAAENAESARRLGLPNLAADR
jgi:hypothetical protein